MEVMSEFTPAMWVQLGQHVGMGFALMLVSWSLVGLWRGRQLAPQRAGRRLQGARTRAH